MLDEVKMMSVPFSLQQREVQYDRITFRQCLRQIREDYIAHGRDWTKPGFRAVAVHRFGNWRMNIRPKLLRAPFSLIYRSMFRRCRNHYGIEIGYGARL